MVFIPKQQSFNNTLQAILLLVNLFFVAASYAELSDSDAIKPPRVAYIGPDAMAGFWFETRTLVQEVAEDFKIPLTIYGANNHTEAYKAFKHIVQLDSVPQYAILAQHYYMGERVLKLAENSGISIIIFNGDFNDNHGMAVGEPRQKYSHWLGHFFPDEKRAGIDLANLLADGRQVKTNKNIISMIGVSGTHQTNPGLQRKQGLIEISSQREDIELKRAIYAQWDKEESKRVVSALYDYYESFDAIWTAGTTLAEGAVLATESKVLAPGKDVLIGTIGWDEFSINALKNRQLYAALGGHRFEASWALILIYDFHQGQDFSSDAGTTINIPMFAITEHNVDDYVEVLDEFPWKSFDFRQLSKVHNHSIAKYDFSVENFLNLYLITMNN